ncbi:MAG: GNAT family N-acetyltransferase [Bacillota bacterium]
MDIIIRKAEKKDLPSILLLYSQPDMDNGEVLDIKAAENIFEKMGQYPDYSVYVAELNGNIVGTFALAIMDNLAHMGAPSGLIEDVVVLDSLQGKGIGKCMMNYAIGICRDKGCYKVSLSSNLKRERAHRFYEGIGFKKHGYSFCMELL